ncbi:MAG: Gfo/Idh/MocA family oxidoreductase [Spirochaetales bacterium]|nr:Gfo/Idh/MocA family oxidoreductase [Spirochaetales bacterium]
MSALRVGIIGAGNAAANIHLPAYARMPDEVELVALASSDPARGAALGARFGIERIYASAGELFAAGGVDAVSVCVANRFHALATLGALEAGLHVLCEKPPAMNAAEAASMEAAAARAGKVLAYGFQTRFAPEARAARALISAGRLGRVYAGKAVALRRRGIPGWGSFGDKAIQGGGPLMDIGVHALDLALYLMDFPKVVEASAAAYAELGRRPGPGLMGKWDPDRYGVEDSLFGFVRFEGGVSLSLETSFALNMKERSRMNVELYGSDAGLSVFPLELYGETEGFLTDTSLPFPGESDAHFECVRDFVRACRTGSEPAAGARQGTELQRLVDLLYRSAELGRAVGPDEA